MAPHTTYEALPRSSDELDFDEQFKDKPLPLKSPLLRRCSRRCSRFCRPVYIVLALLLFVSWQLLFNHSYSSPPPYEINKEETVYIAANIINADLISGAWGRSLQDLVQLIGEERVFVSIYGSPKSALDKLSKELKCGKSIISEEEEPMDMSEIPRTTLPTGESRIKRIAYLAEVRNRALGPLAKSDRKWDKILFINDVFFDPEGATRLIWGTNIKEKDWNGDGNVESKADYKAVCAADFVSSWKYYDTFATRDTEGYSIGVPIFPWFASEGEAVSRRDVLEGREAVRVRSCWGGMVAFQGSYFQSWPKESTKSKISDRETSKSREEVAGDKSSTNTTAMTHPLRFRSEAEPFWDSSECCLIHADILASSPPSDLSTSPDDLGIYMNPYVRTAYTASTYSWIPIAKRFERLLALPQSLLNTLAKMPVWNYRRAEVAGEVVKDRRWVSWSASGGSHNADNDNEVNTGTNSNKELGSEDSNWQGPGSGRRVGSHIKRNKVGKPKSITYWENEGFYEEYDRIADNSGYCGVRQLLVVNEGKGEGDENEGTWDNLIAEVPPLR